MLLSNTNKSVYGPSKPINNNKKTTTRKQQQQQQQQQHGRVIDQRDGVYKLD